MKPPLRGPTARGRWSLRIAIVAAFGAATVVATWPLAISGGASFSLQPDYLSNLWNIWWMHTALFELGVSPWWTDYLFFPQGLSLARHTLSPWNSLVGAVASPIVGVRGAFNLLLLAHFWLSACTSYLLCREVTRSRTAAALGGLVYAFCPYHYYYLAQMNVASTEWIPLAVLFLVRTHREGGACNLLLTAAATLLVAATDWYYLIALFGFGMLLLAFGRLLHPEVPWLQGFARVCGAGLLAAVAVAPLAWPLLHPAGEPGQLARLASSRWVPGYNLLGASWINGASPLLVSWPTWLGYLPLGLVVVGARGLRRAPFWLVVCATFWLVSLGTPIRLRPGADLFPSPIAWLFDLPGLSLFRRPDRLFVIVQLAFATLTALAWVEVRARLPSARVAHGVGAVWILGTMVELAGAPLPRFEASCSPYMRTLARDPSVASLVELPIYAGGHFSNAHYDLCQIDHHKKIPQGYVTSLAVTRAHDEASDRWVRAYVALLHGDAVPLRVSVTENGIDRIVLNRWMSAPRRPLLHSSGIIWAPFLQVRRELLRTRQIGVLMEVPVDPWSLAILARALSIEFGPPEYADDRVWVFRSDPGRAPAPGRSDTPRGRIPTRLDPGNRP
ncbi:MAG: hypothetical protein ACE5IL_14305 [Myxococcota bacterium]